MPPTPGNTTGYSPDFASKNATSFFFRSRTSWQESLWPWLVFPPWFDPASDTRSTARACTHARTHARTHAHTHTHTLVKFKRTKKLWKACHLVQQNLVFTNTNYNANVQQSFDKAALHNEPSLVGSLITKGDITQTSLYRWNELVHYA